VAPHFCFWSLGMGKSKLEEMRLLLLVVVQVRKLFLPSVVIIPQIFYYFCHWSWYWVLH